MQSMAAEQQDIIFSSALTSSEQIVLEFVERAALQGRELDSNEDIAETLGFSGSGSVRGIMLRLERKGFIKCESYQRGRKVYAVRAGKWTRPPLCVVPHWRTIHDKSKAETPTQPVTKLLEFPTAMAEINLIQRERNLPFADAQVLLMCYGVVQRAIERASNANSDEAHYG